MKKSTKEKILEESLELFSQNGYSGTSMSDIADKVGITKAALYKHFSGKEQIFDELLTVGEEHYESNFGSKTKLSVIPKSGEELVSFSLKQIDFTLHDEDIVKFRKLFTIEQFRDEKIAKLATKHFIEIPENMYSLIFEKMMENGALKQDDPKLLAAEYIASATPMINMCDRQPEREEEIIQRISQHFERFISLYAVKQEKYREETKMEKTIFELEQKMWEAALNKDENAFLQLVSEDAVMVCGGFRCSGAEYADLIGEFGIASFEMMRFEVIAETDSLVQVHYVVKTVADSEKNADLAGLFHITSTWKKLNEKWTLIFNMDSRIINAE